MKAKLKLEQSVEVRQAGEALDTLGTVRAGSVRKFLVVGTSWVGATEIQIEIYRNLRLNRDVALAQPMGREADRSVFCRCS